MAKFKKGDFIKANEKSNEKYFITSKKHGWMGKVLTVGKNGHIVATTMYPGGSARQDRYNLIDDYFDLMEDNTTND